MKAMKHDTTASAKVTLIFDPHIKSLWKDMDHAEETYGVCSKMHEQAMGKLLHYMRHLSAELHYTPLRKRTAA